MLTTQKVTTYWKAFPNQGGFFRLEKGVLLYAPMTTNGGIDVESACEVDFDRIDVEQAVNARVAEEVLQESLNCCAVYMKDPQELYDHIKSDHAPFEFEYNWMLEGFESDRPIVCDGCKAKAGEPCICPDASKPPSWFVRSYTNFFRKRRMKVSLWQRIKRAFHQWWDCQTKNCDYYNHYIAYGPAELSHEGYHVACRKCEHWQKRNSEYFLKHPEAMHSPFEKQCEVWEKRVRA